MTFAVRIRPLDGPALRDRPTAASGIPRPRRPFGLPVGNTTAPQNPKTNRASDPRPVTPPLSPISPDGSSLAAAGPNSLSP